MLAAADNPATPAPMTTTSTLITHLTLCTPILDAMLQKEADQRRARSHWPIIQRGGNQRTTEAVAVVVR